MKLFSLSALAHRLLWMMLALLVTSCATQLSNSPATGSEAAIPPLSPELKREPKPSGSYWSSVTEFRKAWEERLKTLRLKSEGSSNSTSR